MRDFGRASSITPSMQGIKMKNERDRVLGRTLAVEETAAVCGADRQAPTTTMYDSATKSDNTVPVIDTTSPITD